MSAYDEVDPGATAGQLGVLSEEELYSGMLEAEHEWRAKAFGRVFDTLHKLNPRKESCLLFDGYAEGVTARRVLMIRHRRSAQSPTAMHIMLNDEKLSDEDLTKRVVEGTEYLLRPLGYLIAKRSCTVQVLPGQYAFSPHAFLFKKPVDSPVATILHGRDYRPGPIQDQPYATELELQDRRMAAESLAGLLETLRPEDATPAHYLFRPAGRP